MLSFRGYGQDKPIVKKIVFRGNEPVPDEALLQQMNTGEESLLDKVKFWKNEPVLSTFMLEDDIERLHSFYQRNGFLEPVVSYNIIKNNNKATIHIDIETGESVVIREVTYSEVTREETKAILSEAVEKQPFKKGDRFVDSKILEYEAELRNKFHDNGYPFIEVERRLDVDTTAKKVDIHYDIRPQTKAYFGETTIKGDSMVEEPFIREQLKFSPGDVFSQEKIDQTQQKLFNTDIFSYVILRPQKEVQQENIPISVELEELPPWSFKAGLGYGTEDRLRLSARVTKLHFLGGARKFIFTAKRSYFYPVSLEAKFIQANLLRDNLSLILNPFYISENETSYSVERLGSGLTLQQIISRSTTGYVRYSLERNFLDDKTQIDSISGDIRNDIRDKS
ncbi:MAG: POTRA domain-containing protein, partial [Bacteroidota bacterium]